MDITISLNNIKIIKKKKVADVAVKMFLQKYDSFA